MKTVILQLEALKTDLSQGWNGPTHRNSDLAAFLSTLYNRLLCFESSNTITFNQTWDSLITQDIPQGRENPHIQTLPRYKHTLGIYTQKYLHRRHEINYLATIIYQVICLELCKHFTFSLTTVTRKILFSYLIENEAQKLSILPRIRCLENSRWLLPQLQPVHTHVISLHLCVHISVPIDSYIQTHIHSLYTCKSPIWT